jgi:hypothetical protein
MHHHKLAKILPAFFAVGLCCGASAVSTTSVGFDGGSDGGFVGNAFFEDTGGNPGGNAHFFVQAFGLSLRTGEPGNPVNDGFVGDYTLFPSVTFSVDIQVNSITNFFGGQIAREIGITLLDNDIQGPSGPAGVYVPLAVISAATTSDWTTLAVTIEDTSSTMLPPGWIGFGDEDPNTFEPILPDGVTFTSLLAGIDVFQLTTFVPGFFFTDANYDVRVGNLSVTTVPLPAGFVLLLSALGAIGLRSRR